MFPTPLVRSVASSLIASWRSLVATDLLFKLFAFAVLTPLFAAFWHALLAFGGSSVLSDVDIAKFFAGPFGWICGIVLGATWLAIVAIEQASLLCILAAKSQGREKNVTSAIHFAITHAASVFNVAARLIGWTLLTALPFLLIAGAVYFALLRELRHQLLPERAAFRIQGCHRDRNWPGRGPGMYLASAVFRLVPGFAVGLVRPGTGK